MDNEKSVRLAGASEGLLPGQLCFMADESGSRFFEYRGKGWFRPLEDNQQPTGEDMSDNTKEQKRQRITVTVDGVAGLKTGKQYDVVGRQGGDPVVMDEAGIQRRVRHGQYKAVEDAAASISTTTPTTPPPSGANSGKADNVKDDKEEKKSKGA